MRGEDESQGESSHTMSMSMLNIMHPRSTLRLRLPCTGCSMGSVDKKQREGNSGAGELYSAQALCAVRTGVSALTTESASTNTSTLAKHLFTSVEINQSLLKKENIFRRSREPVLFVCLLETDH